MPVSAHKGGGIIESGRNVRINLSSHLFLLKQAQRLLCVSVLSNQHFLPAMSLCAVSPIRVINHNYKSAYSQRRLVWQ